jgi:hypothetical protein
MPAERRYDTDVTDIAPLAAYIRENSPVAPKVEGRIEISNSTRCGYNV